MGRRRHDRERQRRTLWLGLSALVVLSMLCSMVLLVQPVQAPAPTPTSPPTVEPTAAPASTPTPQALAPTGTAAGASEFTFAVCGDSRGGDVIFKQILTQAVGDGAAFLIHTGDLVNTGSESQFRAWQPLVADLAIPFYPVAGNHDASGGSLEAYLKYGGAPAAHYSFDRGQAHLAFVDSHLGYLTPEETAWLDGDLAASAQPLKIVVLHYPPFDPYGGSHVMTGGNEAFMALMQKRGVRYVFAGHIHAYGAAERDGVTYVITGGAGAPLIPNETQGGYYHYLRVRVQGADLAYEVVRIKPPVSLGLPAWVRLAA